MKKDSICVSNRLLRMLSAYFCAAITATFALNSAALAAPEHKGEPLLCVLVPHFKDEYWLSVAYGIEQRSAERRLSVRFFEAGGYDAQKSQIDQISACRALRPGAILIGTVSSDAPGLLAAVQAAAGDQPVIGLVNELHTAVLTARVGVDWAEMGLALGQNLAGRFPAGSPPLDAVLLSGPTGAGWVAPLESGLRRGLEQSSVRIVATYGADTGTAEQLRLLEKAVAAHPDIDLVIGSAPAIEAAMALFPRGRDRPRLAATYVSHTVARGLVGGRVMAAPFDDPIAQGRLAVDAAAAAIAGQRAAAPIGPGIVVKEGGIDPAGIDLSPADYFPALD